MLNFFKRKTNFLQTDLHSHLIPDIDDGVKDWDEATSILQRLSDLGYTKVITTPHIIHDYYPNTPDIIREGVKKLNQIAATSGLPLTIEAGAEYFVDEQFAKQVKQKKELLTFGDSFLLIETPFMNKPIFLEEVIFDLQALGVKPILAHPERYTYLYEDDAATKQLIATGVLLQININSLTGYYSKSAKKMAQKLIEQNAVHFLGSDIHNSKHITQIEKAVKSRLFQKCRQLELLNSSL